MNSGEIGLNFLDIRFRILMVCTANVCRSPMAQAILSGILAKKKNAIEVVSAGLLEGGRPMAPEALRAVAGDGLPMVGYTSRHLSAQDVKSADLVLGMTREHVREVVVLVPEAWGYTFTLKELVRLGEAQGPRKSDETTRDWLKAASGGRRRSNLLGAAAIDDVSDPIGGSQVRFNKTAIELRDLCRRLASLMY